MTTTNGFFNRLPGTWANQLGNQWNDKHGWNFISQPRKPRKPRKGVLRTDDFDIQFHQMRETITFKEIGIPRNIGITGEAGFWHAMAYEISIKTPEGEGIHHEMGHFLLNVMDDDPGNTPEELRGDVIRQATIPRANAMMTAGELKPGLISDTIKRDGTPFYGARPKANDGAHQGQIDEIFDQKKKEILEKGGPDMDRPLEWLMPIFPDDPDNPIKDWVFEFRTDKSPSQMASGHRVANPVAIGNLLSDFWLAQRDINGKTTDLLQYAQKVNLIFHGMEWPHVALNTLIKQPQKFTGVQL